MDILMEKVIFFMDTQTVMVILKSIMNLQEILKMGSEMDMVYPIIPMIGMIIMDY